MLSTRQATVRTSIWGAKSSRGDERWLLFSERVLTILVRYLEVRIQAVSLLEIRRGILI
jgi:hypothetical protein